MKKDSIENFKRYSVSTNNKTQIIRQEIDLKIVEDRDDLLLLDRIASEGTKKGFERAKKVAFEIIIAQNGKLIRKRPGKPNQVISKLEERHVEVGQTTSL